MDQRKMHTMACWKRRLSENSVADKAYKLKPMSEDTHTHTPAWTAYTNKRDTENTSC